MQSGGGAQGQELQGARGAKGWRREWATDLVHACHLQHRRVELCPGELARTDALHAFPQPIARSVNTLPQALVMAQGIEEGAQLLAVESRELQQFPRRRGWRQRRRKTWRAARSRAARTATAAIESSRRRSVGRLLLGSSLPGRSTATATTALATSTIAFATTAFAASPVAIAATAFAATTAVAVATFPATVIL